MEELIKKIDAYWDTHEAKEYPGETGLWFDLSADNEGRELEGLLWDNLFLGNGWNYDNKAKLVEAGYRCWVGDGDSFGILVACITKDNKSISIG